MITWHVAELGSEDLTLTYTVTVGPDTARDPLTTPGLKVMLLYQGASSAEVRNRVIARGEMLKVEDVLEIKLTAEEQAAFNKSAAAVKELLAAETSLGTPRVPDVAAIVYK